MNKVLDIVDTPNGLETCIIDRYAYKQIQAELADNNTAFPDVKNIIFQTGARKDGTKTLTTVIFFCDSTKVVVTNSAHDGVTFNEDGTATDCSKETGIVYAICKRLFGFDPKNNGNIAGDGFGRKLRDMVKSAYDPIIADREAKAAKAKSVAEHNAKKAAADAKPKRISLAEAMDKLSLALKEIEELKAKANG